MSVIVPADHHASFAGWDTYSPDRTAEKRGWSRRKQVGFILFAALVSWGVILSPFVFLG